ncbi:hypothetical protein F4775DRAFT_549713 [Biscogniauxia sp. FL1348]|nr:hypothetical protein F4775DRAFT_549713 [Biscogniauxia sp. FL1348]
MRGAACAPVALRALRFGRDEKHELCFEEDIGESIARHIWDAGVVVAGAFLREGVGMGTGMGIREEVLNPGTPLNVLELGTGVGILGISIAAALESAAAGGSGGGGSTRQSTVLLTDLPEAEERARANMARADVVLTGVALTRGDPEARPDALRATRLQYENLDWDEGRRGCFGPLVTAAAAPWDLVVLSDCTYNVDSLPSLVGTLSALHGLSVAAAAERGEAGGFKSTVLLATKPRHESEKALFGLLDAEGWRHRLWKGIPLPNIGGEDEVVEIYLLEKGGRAG